MPRTGTATTTLNIRRFPLTGGGVSFEMSASTTEPTSDVTLTIPHSELSAGKTVSLLADGSDTGQDFVDSTTNSRYSLTYMPSASIGSTVELKAEVDGSGAQSNVIEINVEEGPNDVTLSVDSTGDNQATISWTNADPQQDDLTRVEVHRADSSFTPTEGDFATLVKEFTSPTEGASKSYTDDGTGLLDAPKGEEYYQIISVDADGFTGGSNEVLAQMLVPTGLDVTGADVSWSEGNGPEGYTIDNQTGELSWQ